LSRTIIPALRRDARRSGACSCKHRDSKPSGFRTRRLFVPATRTARGSCARRAQIGIATATTRWSAIRTYVALYTPSSPSRNSVRVPDGAFVRRRSGKRSSWIHVLGAPNREGHVGGITDVWRTTRRTSPFGRNDGALRSHAVRVGRRLMRLSMQTRGAGLREVIPDRRRVALDVSVGCGAGCRRTIGSNKIPAAVAMRRESTPES